MCSSEYGLMKFSCRIKYFKLSTTPSFTGSEDCREILVNAALTGDTPRSRIRWSRVPGTTDPSWRKFSNNFERSFLVGLGTWNILHHKDSILWWTQENTFFTPEACINFVLCDLNGKPKVFLTIPFWTRSILLRCFSGILYNSKPYVNEGTPIDFHRWIILKGMSIQPRPSCTSPSGRPQNAWKHEMYIHY